MKAKKKSETMMSKQFWILIKNKLPRDGQRVLLKWRSSFKSKKADRLDFAKFWKNKQAFGDRGVSWRFTIYDSGGSNWLDDSEAVAWQPIPKDMLK